MDEGVPFTWFDEEDFERIDENVRLRGLEPQIKDFFFESENNRRIGENDQIVLKKIELIKKQIDLNLKIKLNSSNPQAAFNSHGEIFLFKYYDSFVGDFDLDDRKTRRKMRKKKTLSDAQKIVFCRPTLVFSLSKDGLKISLYFNEGAINYFIKHLELIKNAMNEEIGVTIQLLKKAERLHYNFDNFDQSEIYEKIKENDGKSNARVFFRLNKTSVIAKGNHIVDWSSNKFSIVYSLFLQIYDKNIEKISSELVISGNGAQKIPDLREESPNEIEENVDDPEQEEDEDDEEKSSETTKLLFEKFEEIHDEQEQEDLGVELEKFDREQLIKVLKQDEKVAEFIELQSLQKYKRDNIKIAMIKKIRGFVCQICGMYITKEDGTPYIEAAHIKPKAKQGEESPDNILILCPNHHKEFDIGLREDVKFYNEKERVTFLLNKTKHDLSVGLEKTKIKNKFRVISP